MRFATISVVVNLVLGIALFMGPLKYLGLGDSDLGCGLGEHDSAGLCAQQARPVAARCASPGPFAAHSPGGSDHGRILYWAQTKADIIVDFTFDHRLAALLAVTGAGAVVYALASLLTGALRPSEVMDSLRRS